MAEYNTAQRRPKRVFRPSLLLLILILAGLSCEGEASLSIQPAPTYVEAGSAVTFQLLVNGQPESGDVVWSVDGIEGGSPERGLVDENGHYNAPASVPDPAQVVLRAEEEGGASAEVTFTVASVAITVEPGEATVPLGSPQSFVAHVDATPSEEALTQVVWWVEEQQGGGVGVGTIDSSGRYTPPEAIPDKAELRIRARSAVFPDVEGLATVRLASGQGLSVEITPVLEQMALATQVAFSAQVLEPGAGLFPNQGVRWFVNGVEGGTPEAGSISDDGVYTAPNTMPKEPLTVSVQARAVADATARTEVSFLLEQLEVTPDTVEGDQPGKRFPLKVLARLSDGTREDITSQPSTKIVSPRPTVVEEEAGPPRGLALGKGAGFAMVSVEDHRVDPPAVARVAAINRPTYRLEVRPGGVVRSVHPGERLAVQVGVIPDRGSWAGSFLDITPSPQLQVAAQDSQGEVTESDLPSLPVDPDKVVAWWDGASGELVFGKKPGTTTFAFTDSSSGQTVTLTAELVGLELEVTPFLAFEPWTKTDPPQIIITPSPAVPPNETVHLNIVVRGKAGELSDEEVTNLLLNDRIVAEAVSGKGLVRGAGEMFLWSNGQPPTPISGPVPVSSGARIELPVSHVQDVDPFTAKPVEAVGTAALYSPGDIGDQPVRVSLPGTTAAPVTARVVGRLPRLSLKMQNLLGGDRLVVTTHPGPRVFTVSGVYGYSDYVVSQGPLEPANGFTLELAGVDPFGMPISSDQWIALGVATPQSTFYSEGVFSVGLDLPRFLLAMDTPGVWSLAVRAKGYDQDLSPPIEVQVRKGALTIDVSGKAQDLYAASGPIELNLRLREPLWKPSNGTGSSFLKLWADGGIALQPNAHVLVSYSTTPGKGGGVDLNYAPDPGYVDVLCNAEAEDQGKVRISLKAVSAQEAKATVEVVQPLHPNCFIYYWFPYKDSSMTDREVLEQWDQPTETFADYFVITPPRLQATPSVLLLPAQAPAEGRVTRSIRIGGASVLDAFTQGAAPGASSLRMVDSSGNPLSWVTVADVSKVNDFSLKATLAIDMNDPGFALGDYTGRLALGKLQAAFDLSMAQLRLSGPEPGDDDPVLPIPLNAQWKEQKERGVVPFEARLEGTERRAVAHLRVESARDGTNFRLAGFSRRCTRPAGPPQCEVTGGDAFIFLDSSPEGQAFGKDRIQVALYGNTTDQTGADPTDPKRTVPLADGLADVVSNQQGDVRLDLLDGQGHLVAEGVARTTAFNFVTRRIGKLRHGPLNLGLDEASGIFSQSEHFKNYAEAQKALSWWEGDPTAMRIGKRPSDPSRDLFVHVDNAWGGGDQTGVLDTYWLQLTGEDKDGKPLDLRVGNDGRVRDFVQKRPLGDPLHPQVETGTSWEGYGQRLDGVCYDPGVGLDESPNDPSLFANTPADTGGDGVAALAKYKTIQGLIRAQGGISGGRVNPETGEFTVVARTPGADFPFLDCGYLVKGFPEDLKGSWGVYDDIESVLAGHISSGEYPSLTPHLAFDYPDWVATFAKDNDGKEWLRTGVHVGGQNAAFEVVTDPLGKDGKPLLEARLAAQLHLLTPPPYVFDPGDIQLTARVDAMARVYASATRMAVSTALALASGYVGAAYLAGSATVLADTLVNAGVALSFQAADESGYGLAQTLGLGRTSQAVIGSTTSAAAQKGVGALLRQRQGAQTGVAKAGKMAVHEVQPKSFNLKGEAGAFGVDVLGGMLASIINGRIDETDFYSLVDTGSAEAYVTEQLGLTVPRDAPTGQNACGSPPDSSKDVRTLWAVDGRTVSLDAQKPAPAAERVQAPNDEGEAYYRLSLPGPSRLSVLMAPGDFVEGSKLEPSKSRGLELGGRSVANFRLCVGGNHATAIPYFHTVVVAIQRNVEEATASVFVDRSGEMTLRLGGIQVLEAKLP